jgi:hypothetical protein
MGLSRSVAFAGSNRFENFLQPEFAPVQPPDAGVHAPLGELR